MKNISSIALLLFTALQVKAQSNFTGKTSVTMYTDAKNGLNCSMGSVSFEPGARTNWHSHPGGQILLVTAGTAFYQENGKAKQILTTGATISCLPNVQHWHGAAPDVAMTHTTVGPNAQNGTVKWYGKVTDEVYLASPVPSSKASSLSPKQQGLVEISALTAKGNLPILHQAINRALDNGVSVNESKEIFIQLAAYCGFPRSLNAINTLKAVLDERMARGITDIVGKEPQTLAPGTDRYQLGKKNLEALTGRAETGPKTGYAAVVPIIEVFLKEHLFADIFSRGVLSNQERELVTVSALSSLGGVEAQLNSHLAISRRLGLSKEQLDDMSDLAVNAAL